MITRRVYAVDSIDRAHRVFMYACTDPEWEALKNWLRLIPDDSTPDPYWIDGADGLWYVKEYK